MAVKAAAYSEQTDVQRDIAEMVRQFVDELPPGGRDRPHQGERRLQRESGDSNVKKLVAQVVERQEQRARLKKAH